MRKFTDKIFEKKGDEEKISKEEWDDDFKPSEGEQEGERWWEGDGPKYGNPYEIFKKSKEEEQEIRRQEEERKKAELEAKRREERALRKKQEEEEKIRQYEETKRKQEEERQRKIEEEKKNRKVFQVGDVVVVVKQGQGKLPMEAYEFLRTFKRFKVLSVNENGKINIGCHVTRDGVSKLYFFSTKRFELENVVKSGNYKPPKDDGEED